MFKGSLILSSWLLFGAVSDPVQGNTHLLEAQARSFLQQQLETQIDSGSQLKIFLRAADSRLQLEPCGNPVTLSSGRPTKAGSFTLKARCDYPRRWTRYLHGEVKILREVLVSARSLSRGHRIQPQDIHTVAVNQDRLGDGFYTSAQQILGFELNRSLTDNTPLSPKLLTAPMLVQKGDSVTIQAGSNGITVEMAGTALEAGSLNQLIEVKNNKSERVVKASVTGYGQVKVIH